MSEYVDLPISEAVNVFDGLELTDRENLIASRILREIRDRLHFLNDVGVGYLTLGRSAATLSGGEGQRIRLATQIGSNLTGVLYVLDEPSIGLHQRDNRALLVDARAAARSRQHRRRRRARRGDDPHRRLRHRSRPGRRRARRPGDLPGHAGGAARGRQRLADGRLPPRRADDRDAERRGVPATRGAIVIKGARENNLKDIDVAIPLGVLTTVTGVSGSGKSTLVNEILYRALARELYRAGRRARRCTRRSKGIDLARQGHSDRSVADRPHAAVESRRPTPGLFTFIRELFAMLPEAKARGFRPGPLLVQRQGRPLRSVPGGRRHRHRDALPARRLRDVRAVQGPPLQPRDARDQVPRASRSPTSSI